MGNGTGKVASRVDHGNEFQSLVFASLDCGWRNFCSCRSLLISDIGLPMIAVSIRPAQLCRSFEIIRPALLLRPRLRVVRRCMHF